MVVWSPRVSVSVKGIGLLVGKLPAGLGANYETSGTLLIEAHRSALRPG